MSISPTPPTNQAIINNQNNSNKNKAENNLEANKNQTAATNKSHKNTVEDKEKQLNKENPTENSANMAKIIAKNKMV